MFVFARDQNSKNLEQVRKFIDRKKAELDAAIAQERQKLEDAAVSLRTQQDLAAAAVKALKGNAAEFSESAQAVRGDITAFNALDSQVSAYKEKLKDLFEMTSNVEENLRRIKKEAVLVDKLNKRFDDQQRKADSIEQGFPRLLAEFSEQNTGKFNALQEKVLHDFDERAAGLERTVTEAAEGMERTAAETTQKIDALVQEVDSRIAAVFVQAAERVQSLEGEAFDALLKRSQEKLQETQAAISRHRDEAESLKRDFYARLEEQKDALNSALFSQDDSLRSRIDEANARADELTGDFLQKIDLQRESLFRDLESHTSHFQGQIDEARKTAEDFKTLFAQDLAEQQGSLNAALSVLRKDFQGQIDEARKTAEDFKTLFAQDLAEQQGSLNAALSALREDFQGKLGQSRQEADAVHRDFLDNITAQREVLHNALLARDRDFQNELAEARSLAEGTKAEFLARLDSQAAELMAALESVVGAGRAYAEEELQKGRDKLAQFAGDLDSMGERQRSELQALAEAAARGEEMQGKALAELEARLETYRTDILYRFERLDRVSNEIDRLEKNLREAMNLAGERTLAEFAGFAEARQGEFAAFTESQEGSFADFSRRQTGRMDAFQAGAEERAAGIDSKLRALEQQLDALHQSAVDNVSTGLKEFEEAFFASLASKGEAVDGELKSWKNEFDRRLGELSSTCEEERRALEETYSAGLKERIGALRDRVNERASQVEDEADRAQAALEKRIAAAEATSAKFVEDYKSGIAQAAEKANAFIRDSLEKQAASDSEAIKRYEKDIRQKLDAISGNVEASEAQSSAVLEEITTDLAQWKAAAHKQLETTRDSFNATLDALSKNAAAQLSQVQSGFEAGVEQFNTESRSQRTQIMQEIATLKRDVQDAIGAYRARSAEAISEFQKTYDTMLEETARRAREQQADNDHQIRAMKTAVQEIRDKNEAAQAQMVLKMQAEANALTMTLNDIDKRLKQFIDQTAVFDRADELRRRLDDALARLHGDLEKTEAFKPLLAELSSGFRQAQKLEEDLKQKLAKFAAEKKNIDSLDADFKRLMGLSDGINKKILEVQAVNDDIQNYQVEIRAFKETLDSIAARYDRLEKKNPVLDRTLADVDKSFEKLQTLEKELAAYDNQAKRFPAQIEGLLRDVSAVLESAPKIDEAVEKLDSLAGIIAETDTKIETVKTSRDGLARAEQRIHELMKRADERLELLHTLVKEDDKRSRGGIIPPSTRDIVRQLLKDGWKPEEIAKRLSLSRAEVDLILETSH
ncbi:MAG: hypothetical protein LBR23_03060 [Spirochaetaceae bacterium]|nr:hypothetical protein [Spirochaetaceae bacterium]